MLLKLNTRRLFYIILERKKKKKRTKGNILKIDVRNIYQVSVIELIVRCNNFY